MPGAHSKEFPVKGCLAWALRTLAGFDRNGSHSHLGGRNGGINLPHAPPDQRTKDNAEMKLSTEKVLERANAIYRELGGHRPECESRQIKALAQALVEEVNKFIARVELTRTVHAIGGFETPNSSVKNREVPEIVATDVNDHRMDAAKYFTQDRTPNKIVHS